MRLFVAIFITEEEIKDRIISLQNKVNSLSGKLKLVEPNNLHYTLLFLGEVPKAKIDILKRELEHVKHVSPFDLELKGIGVFPNLGRPRVFWVSSGKGSEELIKLAKEVRNVLKPLGHKDSKSFKPHLTIARIKWLEPKSGETIRSLIQSYEETSFGSQLVSQFSLVSSTLTPQGPVYQSIKDYSLQ